MTKGGGEWGRGVEGGWGGGEGGGGGWAAGGGVWGGGERFFLKVGEQRRQMSDPDYVAKHLHTEVDDRMPHLASLPDMPLAVLTASGPAPQCPRADQRHTDTSTCQTRVTDGGGGREAWGVGGEGSGEGDVRVE